MKIIKLSIDNSGNGFADKDIGFGGTRADGATTILQQPQLHPVVYAHMISEFESIGYTVEIIDIDFEY
jgi:hypothetical protein